jgi:hypothetical protein
MYVCGIQLVLDKTSLEINFRFPKIVGISSLPPIPERLLLTFWSLAVSLRTTRFNNKKFYTVIVLL